MSDKVWSQLRSIIIEEVVGEDNNIIQENQVFDHLDSLDFIEMLMKLEDTYDIEITDEDAEKWKTFKDVVDYIDTKI